MKLQIKTETVQEVEVTLPCYRKFGMYTFYKVLNEKESIKISIRPGEFEIQKTPYYNSIAFDKDNSSESTEAEFNAALTLCVTEAQTWNKF